MIWLFCFPFRFSSGLALKFTGNQGNLETYE